MAVQPNSLDDYLQSIRGATQDVTQGFAGLNDGIRQQALANTYAQAPDMIANGQGQQVTSQLAQLGDPTLFRDQLQDQFKQMYSPKQGGLVAKQIQTIDPNVSDAQAAVIEQFKDPKEQATYLNNLKANRIAQANLNLAQGKYQQEQDDRTQKQRNSLTGLDTSLSKLDEQISHAKDLNDLLGQGSSTADTAAIYQAARLAHGAGRLDQQTVNAFKGKNAQGDIINAENYLQGTTNSTLNDNTRSALKNVTDAKIASLQAQRAQTFQSGLANVIDSNPKLVKPDGTLDKSIVNRATRNGYDVSIDPNGMPVVKLKQSVTRQDVDQSGSPEAAVTSFAGQIKDPAIQKQANDAIAHYAQIGKPIPQSVVDKIKAAAGNQ